MLVRDLVDGQQVDQVFLVRERELRRKRDGSNYLRVVFADRSGSVPANIWDDVEELSSICDPGTVVRLRGRFGVHTRYGPQLLVEQLREAKEDEYDLAELMAGPPRSAAQMESDLRDLAATVQDSHLRELLERIFSPDSLIWKEYQRAPAAKYYHQAYRHGLLEHCLSVAQAVSATSAIFPGINRDLAVTGALLHDIGKLDAYTTDPMAIDMTDKGKLQGEIPLGYYRIRRMIEDIPGFPAEMAQGVLHIILSHHGTLEHGSPVVPCTREATLVHMMDNLGGKLGSFDRIEKELPNDTQWSSFDRAIGTGAYFALRSAA